MSEHSLNISIKFKQITRDVLFTCGTTVPDLTGNKNLSQVLIRDNLTCLMLVQMLYYSAGSDVYCCHCSSKWILITHITCYPIRTLCKHENKKQTAKHKTRKLKKEIIYEPRLQWIFKIALGAKSITSKYKETEFLHSWYFIILKTYLFKSIDIFVFFKFLRVYISSLLQNLLYR